MGGYLGSGGDLTGAEAAVLGGVIAGMVGFLLLVSFILWLLLVIAHWRMFTKANEAGWKSIIPIYSDYALYRLVWNTTNFWVELSLSIGAAVVGVLGGKLVVDMNGEVVAASGNPVFGAISFALTIAALVWSVRVTLKTAYAYSKGTGFGIGLIFLPNIFSLILGFGSAKYVGPQK